MLSGPETISRINTDGALCSGGGPANVITEAVRLLIERGGLESHMERVRSELGRRQEALAEAVHRHLGGLGKVTPVDGGYFAMVDLGLDGGGAMGGSAEGLRGYCEEVGAGVLFMPVNRCSVGGIAGCPVEPGEVGFGDVPVLGGLWSGKARLSVSYYEVEEIEEGVRRLGEAVEGYKKRLVGLGVGADGEA
jgi:DNA-binding transcriptional MocR family regulator